MIRRRALLTITIAVSCLWGMAIMACGQIIDNRQVSPHLAMHLEHHAGDQDSLDVLMRFADDAEGEQLVLAQGGRLLAWIGHVAVVRGTTENMACMAGDDNVVRMEAEPCGVMQTDVSGQIVHATEVHAGESLPRDFTGEGVCCALLDNGFDFTHPAFKDSEGQLRVEYFYDAITGDTFEGTAAVVSRQCSTTAERSWHGTHVMGIMGGSACGPFCGMAPDATLLAADFDGYPYNYSGGTSATVILAMKKLFDRADLLGMPCVLNFSSSVGYLPGSPRTLEEECLDAMTSPGHIIVCAASNRGEKACWMHKETGKTHCGAMMNNVTSNYSGVVEWDLFTDGETSITLGLLNSGHTEEEQLLKLCTTDILQAEGQTLSTEVMRNTTLYTLTGNAVATAGSQQLYHFTLKPSRGSLHSTTTLHLDGDVEATVFLNADVSAFVDTPAPDGCCDGRQGATIGWPAASPSVIAVGATAHTLTYTNLDGEEHDMADDAPEGKGRIARFSSRGPAAPGGRQKPDVCAPGVAIKAPMNSFFPMTDKVSGQLVWQTEENGNPYYYVAQSGTSMASPMVAGVIALWLQSKADLTTEEVRQLFALSCSHPEEGIPYPNDRYGHGEINAHGGLLHLLGASGIRQMAQDFHSGGESIYNLQGQLVLTGIPDGASIGLKTLPRGIYVVKTGQGCRVVKVGY